MDPARAHADESQDRCGWMQAGGDPDAHDGKKTDCLRMRHYAIDGMLAIAVATFATIAAHLAEPSTSALDVRGHLLLLVASLSLVARRRFPLLVLIVAAVCSLGYLAKGYPGLMTTLPVPFAVYTAVSTGHRRAVIVALATVLLGTILAVGLIPGFEHPMRDLAEAKFLILGWMVAGGVMAETAKHRRAYIDQVEQRAIDAERTREETARRRASDERLRIARELHDSLTHSISIVKVQAGVAIHLARKKHEEVPGTLLAIEEASSEAIRELRATLDVLRQPGGNTEDHGNGYGLERLGEMVDRARAAGLDTTLTVEGSARPLPVAIDQAAYRIAQEALTNVARHAGPSATASIRLAYTDDEVSIQVDDDGWATAGQTPIPGVGLIGMRERVTALGGHVRAEPRTEGGFTVHAHLPLAPPVQDDASSITPAETSP